MFLYGFKRLKTIAILLVAFVLLLSFLAVPVEARSCEEAFFDCWNDFTWAPLSGAVFCGAGYIFCIKYIR